MHAVDEHIFITNGTSLAAKSIIKELMKFPAYVKVCVGIYSEDAKNKRNQLAEYDVQTVLINGLLPHSIDASFQRMDTLIFIPFGHENRVIISKNFIDALKKQQSIKRVFLLSSFGANHEDYYLARQCMEIEMAFQKCSVPNLTIIRPNFYYETLFMYAEDIRHGILKLPIGDKKFSPVSVEDVGLFMVHVLFERDGRHNGKIYELSGPESLSGDKFAYIASNCLQKEIRFKFISDEESMEFMDSIGIHSDSIRGITEYYNLVSNGKLDVVCTTDFENICKRKPKSLNSFFAENFCFFKRSYEIL